MTRRRLGRIIPALEGSMDRFVRRLGPFRGEFGGVAGDFRGRPFYSYVIREDATEEVLAEGYAGGVQEAIQTIDLYLDYFAQRAGAA